MIYNLFNLIPLFSVKIQNKATSQLDPVLVPVRLVNPQKNLVCVHPTDIILQIVFAHKMSESFALNPVFDNDLEMFRNVAAKLCF
jgi:hypothetical protein